PPSDEKHHSIWPVGLPHDLQNLSSFSGGWQPPAHRAYPVIHRLLIPGDQLGYRFPSQRPTWHTVVLLYYRQPFPGSRGVKARRLPRSGGSASGAPSSSPDRGRALLPAPRQADTTAVDHLSSHQRGAE